MKKKILGIGVAIAAVSACIALLPLQAFFRSGEEIQKLKDGEAVSIEVELPKAHGEKISSLQLSLAVTNQDGEPASADSLGQIEELSFVPDEAVSSKTEVWEQIYHEETGILDIYIAGTEPLFSSEDTLSVGNVTAEMSGGEDLYIKVEEDSFKVVKGIELEPATAEQGAVVRISADGAPVPPAQSAEPPASTEPTDSGQPQETEPAEEPESSAAVQNSKEPESSAAVQNSKEPESSAASQTSDVPSNSAVPQDSNMPQSSDVVQASDIPQEPGNAMNDTSKLREALDIAATFQETDYTEDSFALLKKAVEAARAVLNDPNATQEEVDQAADAVYNAIGTLVRSDKTSAEQPANPAQPAQTPSSSKVEAASTGDTSSIIGYVLGIAGSAAVFMAACVSKKRQKI